MGSLRHLSLPAIRHSFMFTASSLCSKANPVADSLSCFQFQHFCRLVPQADLTVCDSGVTSGHTSDALTLRCQFLLTQGLTPSTRHVYLSAQHCYINFCRQDGHLNQDGSFPAADEETLMLFASLLADNLTHSSIKVFLSVVRPLHIDHGLSDPFVNCLRLQRLLRRIKWVQGPVSPCRPPITLDHLQAIQRGLDFSWGDHVMRWAACYLAFFGFL